MNEVMDWAAALLVVGGGVVMLGAGWWLRSELYLSALAREEVTPEPYYRAELEGDGGMVVEGEVA